MSTTQEIKLEVSGNTSELVIRTGDAAQIYDPKAVNQSGAISAPREFLSGKLFKIEGEAIVNKEAFHPDVLASGVDSGVYFPHQATLYVDRDKKSLQLKLNERDEFADVITGKLQPSVELGLLQINTEKRWDVQTLKRLLKQSRYMFRTQEEQAIILSNLEKFNATVTTKLVQESSNKGNSHNAIERSVAGLDWANTFVLNIPLFKGGPKKSFVVELAIDPTDGAIKFFLDSPDLYELEQNELTEAFASELKYFEEWGCSIVTIS